MVAAVVIGLALMTAWAAECTMALSPERVEVLSEVARRAWSAGDVERAARAASRADGECLVAVVDRETAAELLVLHGLAAASRVADPAAAARWWATARSLGAAPLEPLEGAWETAWASSWDGTLRYPAGVIVDGGVARSASAGGHVVQVDRGRVWTTLSVEGGIPAAWTPSPGRVVFDVDVLRGGEVTVSRTLPRYARPVTAAGIGMLVSAAGLLAGHLALADRFDGLEAPESERQVRGLASASNGLLIGAAALGAGGVSAVGAGVWASAGPVWGRF